MNGVIAVNGRKVGGGMTAISGYVQQVGEQKTVLDVII